MDETIVFSREMIGDSLHPFHEECTELAQDLKKSQETLLILQLGESEPQEGNGTYPRSRCELIVLEFPPMFPATQAKAMSASLASSHTKTAKAECTCLDNGQWLMVLTFLTLITLKG